ncbi:hypothetical protein [Brenneria corticis]|uniref:Transporter n=1 Tax=Brenneria corticis TaxID=2173106 RepID=A0A2U1UCU9_9GAMM|nr:hypothetical protein [Brenneria sp. CFCC 11842]PWC19491.1 hypothetical protein DDT56_00485 [Brenneria sp. CFCC 11842]
MSLFEYLSGCAHLLAVIALLLANLFPDSPWLAIAMGATVLATLLRFTALSRLAQGFFLGAIAAFGWVAWRYPLHQHVIIQALAQGAAFSCLLIVLGLLRYPVSRSGTVREAAGYLLSFPAGRRYVAVNAGSHFLSLLFNVGIIPLIADQLGNGGNKPSEDERRIMLLAGMRGAVLMTIWSPMGLGFAIVTTALTALNSMYFVAAAFASALLIMAVTCFWAMRCEGVEVDVPAPARAAAGSPRTLLGVLLACALLLAGVIGIHIWLQWSFVVSTVLVLPLFALGWLCLERSAPGTDLVQDARHIFRNIGSMRMESAIFLSANVIGAAISLTIQQQPGWQALQSAHFPALAVLLACLLIVPLAGALFIPHSIFVVLLAQIFGASELGLTHPMALALALTLGWAMAIAVSPISAMSLLTGSLCGVRPQKVGLQWNRGFVGLMFIVSAAIIGVAYWYGG